MRRIKDSRPAEEHRNTLSQKINIKKALIICQVPYEFSITKKSFIKHYISFLHRSKVPQIQNGQE